MYSTSLNLCEMLLCWVGYELQHPELNIKAFCGNNYSATAATTSLHSLNSKNYFFSTIVGSYNSFNTWLLVRIGHVENQKRLSRGVSIIYDIIVAEALEPLCFVLKTSQLCYIKNFLGKCFTLSELYIVYFWSAARMANLTTKIKRYLLAFLT